MYPWAVLDKLSDSLEYWFLDAEELMTQHYKKNCVRDSGNPRRKHGTQNSQLTMQIGVVKSTAYLTTVIWRRGVNVD